MGKLEQIITTMLKKLRILRRFISFLMTAKSKHGIHSPFVFDFVTKVLNNNTQYPAYNKIEEQRQRLLHNNNLIEIVDFGEAAGASGYITALKKVKDVAKRSAISHKQGQLLHRTIRHFKPEILLELGTSLGVSSMYQLSAASDSFYIGMEGCATTAAIAERNLEKFGDETSYSLVIGNFDVMLPGVLEKLDKIDYAFIDGNHTYESTLKYFNDILPLLNKNSVVIFHDIHWSTGMEKAWLEIINHPAVTISIDIFHMGFVFFREGVTKQDFKVRF
jgi:predicted O-methyltransferase YrrM